MAPLGRDPAREIRTPLGLLRDAAPPVYVSSTGVYSPGHDA
jgi:hypothetical protein